MRSRWNWAAWIACALLGLAMTACGGAKWDTTPQIRKAGAYDVKILRDTWGVPHVFGKTDADAAFGLAYAQSEDDFATLQQTLLATRALLASVEGKDAAPIDYLVQAIRVREHVWDRYESDLSPATRRLVEAYADGVNYYAALHPEQVEGGVFPVDGRDVVAGFVMYVPMFYGLAGAIESLFGDERPGEVTTKKRDVSGRFAPRLPTGSNAFAVSPKRSSDGQTMLCVNSHQPWDGPLAWYEAHVHSDEGWDATGALFPGAPMILVGHNRDLGWGATVNLPDLYDIYVLEVNPDDPDTYRLDGEWLDFEESEAKMLVRLPGGLKIPVKRKLYWSVQGPVFKQKHGTYAVRYAGMDDIRMVEQWYRMNKAETFTQWRDAMAMMAVPSFNFVYADRTGTIYYLYNAAAPVREPGYDWTKFLPGNTADAIWNEVYTIDAMPQIKDPESGFIQSCNSTPFQTTIGPGNPDPADFPAEMGIETYMTNRALRAVALYGGDESITWEEFQAYKWDELYDPASPIGQIIRVLLDAPLPDDPLAAEAVDVLRHFEWNAHADNAGLALISLTSMPILYAKFLGTPQPDPVESMMNAAKKLKRAYGRLDVPWGTVARMIRGGVDLPLSGGPDTLRAIEGMEFKDGHLADIIGDGYVMFVEWDADGTLTSQAIHQYGAATTVPDSPHYADQAELFVRKQVRPVWFTEDEIRNHLELEYRPGEERFLKAK